MPELGDWTLDKVQGVAPDKTVFAQHRVNETVTIHEFPAAQVYVYINKRAANKPREKTGRSGKNMGNIASLLGNAPATPTPVDGQAAGCWRPWWLPSQCSLREHRLRLCSGSKSALSHLKIPDGRL